MKNLFLVLMLAVLAISCSNSNEGKTESTDSTKTAAIAPENLQTAEFTISGMTCEGCENTVCTAVKENAAVTEASASFSTGKASFAYDKTRTSTDEITKTIEGKGYKVEGFAVK
jgi:copper chaperone CopZ